MIQSRAIAVIVALATLVAAVPSAGQSAYTEGRALEFRTDLPWARLTFENGDRIAGVSPLRVPGPLAGEFWLSAYGPGVEPQRGRVRVRLDEEGSRIVSYGGLPLRETVMRSALWPGYAQWRSRQRGKGFLLASAGAVAVGWTLWAQDELWEKEDAVAAAELAVSSAGIVTEREIRLQELRDARIDRDYAADRRVMVLSTAAAVWGVGLVDALLFSPRFQVERADESSLTLGMQRKTRFDAVLRSALLPGLGQDYNGHPRKGALVALGALGAGWWLLHEQDDYDDQVRALDIVDQRLESATTVDERDALAARRLAIGQDVDDAWRNRNIALGIAGGLWALNVVDAAISFAQPWGGRDVRASAGGIGWSADPLRGRLAAQVRF